MRTWRASSPDLTRVNPEPRSGRAIFTRGFLVSLSDPKILLFYGAFLPQFVVAGADPGPQLAPLAVTFSAVAVALDGCWALAVSGPRGAPAMRGTSRNRLTSGC